MREDEFTEVTPAADAQFRLISDPSGTPASVRGGSWGQLPKITAEVAGTGQFQLDGREFGDTGWRDVAGDLATSSFVLSSSLGRLHLRRVATGVRLIGRLQCATPIGPSRRVMLSTLALGFRPVSFLMVGPVALDSATSAEAFGMINTIGSTARLDLSNFGSWATSPTIAFDISWETNDAWPSTLPGTPV